jgi:hypothetical protein
MSNPSIPFSAKGLCINVTATSAALAAVALPTADADCLLLFNEGPNNAWFAVGASTVLATVPTTGAGVNTCTPIPAGMMVVYSRSPTVDLSISTITRSGTANISVLVGEGS